jgi:wyosine [tRNA(Phe)-imidazoG37] synthetase (radical SAM superfamily)
MNLLPYDGKLCSFDCIYCECGYNEDFRTKTRLPDRENVRAALEDKLIQLQKENTLIDVITFAGNGEPTVHPQFAEIIDDTIVLRDKYYPDAKISVLSNAMHAGKQKIFDALKKVDNNILKLDSAILDTVRLIDRPNSPEYSIEKQVELFKRFNGDFIMQTMFVRGSHKGKVVDNTTEEEISAWLEAVKATNPREVMIYTIDRETPEKNLEKVPVEKMKEIGKRVEALGIKVSVAG